MFKKSIITAAVMSSIAFTAQAQSTTINNDGVATIVSQDHQGRFTSNDIDLATQSELNLVRDGQGSNYDAITNIRRVVNQHDDAIGGIGQLSQRITTLESHTVTNGVDGRDGTDGANGRDGRNGIDGINGQDGRDGIDGRDASDSITVMQGIAGASALSFANSGGAGLGFGIATFEGQNAGAISYTHEFNNRFSASFGASSSGSAGGGFKFKF